MFATCTVDLHENPDASCTSWPPLGPEEQATLFLERYPDFQITEISCVRDYLMRRLQMVCMQVEDEAVETLPNDTFIFDPNCDIDTLEWNCGYYAFTKTSKSYANGHLEHLMSLGLPYIRRLLEADGIQKRDLYLRESLTGSCSHDTTAYTFLTEALFSMGPNPAYIDKGHRPEGSPPFLYGSDPDVQLGIPDAWQWAHPEGPPVTLDNSPKAIRDWGYVFWDLDRLRDLGVLQKDPWALDSFSNSLDDQYLSVQERLTKEYVEDELNSWGS